MANGSHFSLDRAELPENLASLSFVASNFVMRVDLPSADPNAIANGKNRFDAIDEASARILYDSIMTTFPCPMLMDVLHLPTESAPYYDFLPAYYHATGDKTHEDSLRISWYSLRSPQLIFLDVFASGDSYTALTFLVSKIVDSISSGIKVQPLLYMNQYYPPSAWQNPNEKGIIGTWFYLSSPLHPSDSLPSTCSIGRRDLFANIYVPMYEKSNTTS